ncbi:hypothetical protein [Paraburkholderia silvatlantica]|uniref:hypothetical protein n=1 Tax=Paraburkholderia silvatlantica TaxID=321895 RepID=UPI0037508B4A
MARFVQGAALVSFATALVTAGQTPNFDLFEGLESMEYYDQHTDHMKDEPRADWPARSCPNSSGTRGMRLLLVKQSLTNMDFVPNATLDFGSIWGAPIRHRSLSWSGLFIVQRLPTPYASQVMSD